MKKVIIVIAILVFILMTAGCSTQLSTGSMQISPAQLTSKEEKIQNLIQGDTGSNIFDYTVGKDAKTVSVACYKLDDSGNWVLHSGWDNFPIEQTTGRIAITYHNLRDGMRVASQSGDSLYANESISDSNSEAEGTGSGTSYADTESIVYEKEVPLVIQVFTNKDTVSTHGVSSFDKPEELKKMGYEAVYVVVVKFSKHELI